MKKNEIGKQIYDVTNQIAQLMGSFEFMQKKCSKLGRVECNLLHYLIQTDRNVNMKELSEHLGVTHSRITHLVDSLIKKNYLVRFPSTDDRRVFYTQINEEGKEMLNKHINESIKSYNKILNQLDENELTLIFDALSKWKDFLYQIPQGK
ncbi:MAG: MarR family transcriptional regulator [Candidatus Cloacimonadales bacterium]|jgi:DNA-binding MarR family transcriptional regulator|nr:MarR family transcriptional regulator [Candidatus Cloacimonadota bacterium]MDD2651028.1 MarR family transcriptional regulator [Candidatus Cloacimonadota bacterium]MDX9977908.1 MarR family transcriptional regulator [Candidatus Cloacimonadales bacterium]